MSLSWFSWALLSAIFAALTAIFAKLGVQHINSDLATLLRTAMILLVLGCYIGLSRQWSNPLQLSGDRKSTRLNSSHT